MPFVSSYQLHPRKFGVRLALAVFFLAFSGVVFSSLLYPQFFLSVSRLEKVTARALDEPVSILFSAPMTPQTFDGKISIYPEAEVRFRWQDQNRKLTIIPQKKWKPETDYQLVVGEGRNIMFFKHSGSFNFQTKAYPKVSAFSPEPGSQEVLLDIEDPISVTFDKSVEDFKIKVAVEPPLELTSQLDLENNQLKLLPKVELARGASYVFRISIKGLDEKEETYREIYQSSFRTKPSAPAVWEKDFPLRLIQAKKYTEAKIKDGKYIDINVKTQVMTLFENGQALDVYLVSSGKRGMDTPQGSFQIANKFPRAWSKTYGLFMPFWMAIVPSGKFGIHELPEWPSGYKEGASHLGTPVSHGCVRLGVGAAERVYDWTIVGTPVVVHS